MWYGRWREEEGPHGGHWHEGRKHLCFRDTPVRGLLHLAILSSIRDKSTYGSELEQVLKSKFGVEAPKPIIYGLLRRMEHFGFLASKWDVEGSGPARRVYKITEEGLEYLNNALERLRKVRDVINNLVSEPSK
jgi:PadR family transcriptional regulator PadR